MTSPDPLLSADREREDDRISMAACEALGAAIEEVPWPPAPGDTLQETRTGHGAVIAAELYRRGFTVAALSAQPAPDALRALSDAATGGKWKVVADDEYVVVNSYVGGDEDDEVAVLGTPNQYTKADAAFIVAAVNYVRAALGRSGSGGGRG